MPPARGSILSTAHLHGRFESAELVVVEPAIYLAEATRRGSVILVQNAPRCCKELLVEHACKPSRVDCRASVRHVCRVWFAPSRSYWSALKVVGGSRMYLPCTRPLRDARGQWRCGECAH